MQTALASAARVTRAAYDSGYNSSSRFYANAAAELGMSPTAYRSGAANATIRFACGDIEIERQLAAAIVLASGDSGERSELALDIAGTAFAQRVWAALRDVPYGETATYGESARRIGAPGSARAVAKACANNTIALAIPCHRIVREDGTDMSYRWGAARKRELLRRERGNRTLPSEKHGR